MNDISKYKEGDFGYWWTITEGNYDIEDEPYFDDIDCSLTNITSLKGCPLKTHNFICSYNKLESLEYAPRETKNFLCIGNKLTNLLYSPKIIEGIFDISSNNLTTLEGCPNVISGSFNIFGNKLKSLSDGPDVVDGYYNCAYNELTTLEGCPTIVYDTFDCYHNHITDLSTINGKLINQKKSHSDFVGYANTNKYLELEFLIRSEYPNYSELEILDKMFLKTKDKMYLSKEANQIFL